jgi:hypothetical protein
MSHWRSIQLHIHRFTTKNRAAVTPKTIRGAVSAARKTTIGPRTIASA